MRATTSNIILDAAFKKYESVIEIDPTGKRAFKANALMSLLTPEEYAALIMMENLITVDHVILDKPSPYSPQYWMMKELSLSQTILLWLTCSAVLINMSTDNPNQVIPAFIGFISWVAIEYGYHRFIGHMPVIDEHTKSANFYLHGKHHFAPKDTDNVFLPPFLIFAASVAFYKFVFSNISKNPEMSLAFAMLHYLIYEVIHYSIHKYERKDLESIQGIGKMLGYIWGNHHKHHAVPDQNMSVSTGGMYNYIQQVVGKAQSYLCDAAKMLAPN